MKIRADHLSYVPAVVGMFLGGAMAAAAWVMDRLEIVDRASDIEENDR